MTASGSVDRFAGRIAVVTGAAAGIGAATARRLADEGAAVVIADVDETQGVPLHSRSGRAAAGPPSSAPTSPTRRAGGTFSPPPTRSVRSASW